jgi:hypothetical protein
MVVTILGIVLGTGAASLINTLLEHRRMNKLAKENSIKVPIEVENMRLQNMQIVIDNLQEEVDSARKDRDYWRQQAIDKREDEE